MNFKCNTGLFCILKRMQSSCFLGTYSAYMHQTPIINNPSYVQHLPQVFLDNISAYGRIRRLSTNSNVQNSSTTVKHNSGCKRFFIEVENVGCAYLEYERENRLIKLMHTDVPVVLGGRGLGKLLAKEALEYVAMQDYQLEIHCPFVRNYISKYAPKYITYLKQ